MKKDPTVPVYVISGFLDGGKTNFLKYTMAEDYFNDGTKSLLVLCEEGEEEYDDAFLKKTRAQMVKVGNPDEITPEYFENLQKTYKPERVLIEYNGMWDIKKMVEMPLPKYWLMYQIITVLDGSSFALYLNNIKMSAMLLLTNTDMVIFNRCDQTTDLVLYQRTVRSVNARCDLVFEDTNGKEMECPEPDLPYDVKQKKIGISDENYATFFLDLQEHPDRYVDKEITSTFNLLRERRFPKNMFVGGRKAMTCCAADIRFLPYIFIYDQAEKVQKGGWAKVSAVMKWEFHEGYQEEGPVFHVTKFTPCEKPADELVYF